MTFRISAFWAKLKEGLTVKKLAYLLLGAAICSFGIHNIHQRVSITEGGVIGLMLLIEHWFNISSAYITFALDIACYLLALKFLGGKFIKLSIIATAFISAFYKIWEMLPPLLPDLSSHPFIAAVVGGIFVGVGVGIIVRQGGSSGGDDALALTISRALRWRLSRAYMLADIVVLLLSLSYIPAANIIFSLITVTISSNIIDRIKDHPAKSAAVSASGAAPAAATPAASPADAPLPRPAGRR